MRVQELTRDQLIELKQRYYMEKHENDEIGVSWGELAEIDTLVSDEEIFEAEAETDFCNDDFFCSANL